MAFTWVAGNLLLWRAGIRAKIAVSEAQRVEAEEEAFGTTPDLSTLQ